MVFLEKKKLKGHIYWYASERSLVDGKIKRTWQEYPGTTETIIDCIRKSKELPHIKLKSFQYGKTAALLSLSDELNFINIVNKHTNKKQQKSYEASKAKICEKLKDLKRRLGSNRGKERDKSSVEREFNDIIHKDFRSIFGHKVGEIPEGKKKPSLEIWIENEVEKLRYAGFGKTIVFTDMHTWHSEKIAKTYNRKYLVEDEFKWLNVVLLVPVGPINHHKDFNIRAHIFLCIIGMIFYRYLAWKCKHLGLSLKRLVEELEGFRVALVQGKTGDKVELVVEKMDAKQARLFSLLDLGKFMER